MRAAKHKQDATVDRPPQQLDCTRYGNFHKSVGVGGPLNHHWYTISGHNIQNSFMRSAVHESITRKDNRQGDDVSLPLIDRPSLKPYNQNRLHRNEIISNSDSNSVRKPTSAFGPPLKHQWKIPKSMGSRWLNPLTTDVISPHPLSSVRLSNLRLPSILRRLLMPGCEQILQHHMIRIDSYIGAGCDTLKDYYPCSSCFKIARNCDKYQQHSI